ncbi:hypothetical protein ABPG77_007327 [Micractinium sp. CCAP 211/92]
MSSAALVVPAGLCRSAGPALGRQGPRRRRAGLRRSAPTRFDDLTASDGIRDGMTTFDDLWAEQMHAMQRAQLEMSEMQRMMDQRFAAAQAEARQLDGPSSSGQELLQKQQTQDGRCGYRWQRSYERSSGSYHKWRSESFTVIGVQPPGCAVTGLQLSPPAAGAHLGAPWLLLAGALAGFWAAATAAFNRRFHLTIYKEGSRWRLLLLWPVLLIVSPEFRQQFMAAVRGIRSQGGQGAAAQSDGASSAFAAPGMQTGKQA